MPGHMMGHLLEAAFDQFSDTGRSPGLVIVKSAGNTRDKDIHAKLALAPDDVDQLQWDQPDEPHPGPDILELWFNASDDFTFSIIDPQVQELKTKASWTLPSVSGAFPSGNTADLEFTRYHHDNGDSRFQVTVRRGNRPAVLCGTWTLTIKSRRVPLGGEIHAWLERDDSSRVQFMNHINEEMTLSIPGTARSVICVAAVDTTSQPGAVKTPHYSAYGRVRDDRRKPDLAAPGQAVYAAEAGTGNGAVPKSGTSMAAPHVTGAVALLLSCWAKNQPTRSQLTANQVRAALCQGAQSFNPAWNRGRGYGLLDAQSLLAAFL